MKKYEILLTIICIGFLIYIGIVYSNFHPDTEYSKRTIYPVVKNKGLPSQAISYEYSRYGFFGDKAEAPYTGECEKELFNRYADINNSTLCMNTFISQISDTNQTYQQLFNHRKELLSCVEIGDTNFEKALDFNYFGIDIPIYTLPGRGILCHENKELLSAKLLPFKVVFGLLFLFPVFLLIISKKGPKND